MSNNIDDVKKQLTSNEYKNLVEKAAACRKQKSTFYEIKYVFVEKLENKLESQGFIKHVKYLDDTTITFAPGIHYHNVISGPIMIQEVEDDITNCGLSIVQMPGTDFEEMHIASLEQVN